MDFAKQLVPTLIWAAVAVLVGVSYVSGILWDLRTRLGHEEQATKEFKVCTDADHSLELRVQALEIAAPHHERLQDHRFLDVEKRIERLEGKR